MRDTTGDMVAGNGAEMPYLLGTEVIYANAFQPLGKFGTYLSQDEIDRFCHIVGEELSKVTDESGGIMDSSVGFDLSAPLTESMAKRFVVVTGYVMRVGSPVSNDELSSCNLCLGDDRAIRTALSRARARFAEEIGLGRRPALAPLILRKERPDILDMLRGRTV